MVFSCQPFFETCSRNTSNFVPRTESQHLDTFCNRNEPKQSINTAWQITEVSNSAKQKVNIPKTEQLNERMSQTLFTDQTISHFPVLLRYALPVLRLQLCSTVQLCLLLWPRELDKPPSSRLACCLLGLFITDLNTALLV